MEKYIDADKLIKSVNNYQEGAKAALNPTEGDADYYKGKIDACKDIQEFITYLWQEQSEHPTCGYDEAYLNDCIAKASKSWKGVDVDKFMDEVRGREPDKSLEEAAEEYATMHLRNNEFPTADRAFIAGAKWQAEQDDRDVVFWKGMQHAYDRMKEDAVNGIYTKSMDGKNVFVESGALKIDPESVKVGDPVKLIIIKDNESD